MRKVSVAAGWAWAAAIVWLSLTPAPPRVDFAHSDKLGHFAAYGLLMFWFCQLYDARAIRVWYAVAFVAMGIGLEFAQGALGYRTYDMFDLYANSIGVLLGWGAAIVLPRIRMS
jgi:VanZ family protein